MCYPKPGPRCSSHTRQDIKKITENIFSLANDSVVSLPKLDQEFARLKQAVKDHDATEGGIKALEEAIRKSKNSTEKEALYSRYTEGLRGRKEKLSEYTKLQELKKMGVTVTERADSTPPPPEENTLNKRIRETALADLDSSFQVKKERLSVGSSVHNETFLAYQRMCQKENVSPDLAGYLTWATSFKSRAGNYGEQVIESIVNTLKEEDGSLVQKYFVGKKVEASVKNSRKMITNNADKLESEAERLSKEYHMNKEWVKSLLSDSSKELSFPDGIAFLKGTNGKLTVRIFEAKLSGELDSKNLPANIKALNKTASAWDGVPNVEVEKAIALTATPVDENGRMRMKGPWENRIAKEKQDIAVYGNEEVITWVSGHPFSKELHQELFIQTIAEFSARRIYAILHK